MDTVALEALDLANGGLRLNERQVFTVKQTETWLVELVPMLYNIRLVLTPVDDTSGWEHAWCFFGRTPATLLRAVAAALAFDPEEESAPAGYDKALTWRR